MDSENLSDFFAAPRKAKAQIVKKIVEPKKEEIPTIKERSLELKSELEVRDTKISKPQRYQAQPKKKIEKKFDQFMKKSIQINEEDLKFLSDLERSISFTKKKSNNENKGLNRITSNTIIRLMLEDVCKKAGLSLENNKSILSKLKTEDDIRGWIENLK